MKLVDIAIKKPITVTVGVIFLVLFGLISLFRIPIQLTPNVDLPEISVETRWSGASPLEVEREIVDVQEEELKNLEGLDKIKSESRDGMAYINLMFEIGTETDEALLRASNKLDQVRKYPDNAEKPSIKSGGRHENAIAWMILCSLDGYKGSLKQEYDFIDKHVKPRIERIAGMASSNIYGGRERELQVIIDQEALAARKITIPELMRALDIENNNISAGNFDEGKRRYIARTVGEYKSVEDVSKVIIKRENSRPVAVGDIAGVQLGYEDMDVVVRHEGVPTIVMNAVREPGSNVLIVMERLKENPRTRFIPVHFISGDDRTAEVLEKGAIGLLMKPVSAEDIENCFEKFETLINDSIKSVLIVEDSREQQKNLKALLEVNDITSTAIGTGEEAVELLKNSKFDCMILDIGLAGKMTGFELADKIKNDNTIPHIPIIVYTGRNLSDEEEILLKKCSDSIILKGINSPGRLTDEVNLFLHKVENELPENCCCFV